ncbi:DHH family protein [Coprothermobacteraceae bacterium]|nr:DHH family protein [Coprothermobacteraceae bacterium]
MELDLVQDLRKRVDTKKGVLILTHERPDIDALGSVSGLGWVLSEAGIPFTLEIEDWGHYSRDLIPKSESVCPEIQVLLDTSEPSRVFGYRSDLEVFVVDHHPQETVRFSGVIDTSCCSTSALLAKLVRPYLDSKSSTCLLAGLLSDSGVLTYSNTNEGCVSMAIALLEAGADWEKAYREATKICGWEQAIRIGHLLSRVKAYAPGVYMLVVSAEERTRMKFTDSDFSLALSLMQWIGDGRLFVTVRENPRHGVVNVSLRSRGTGKALELAKALGGGGHRMAAAAKLRQELQLVVLRVTELIEGLEREQTSILGRVTPEDEQLAELLEKTAFLSTGVDKNALSTIRRLVVDGADPERASWLARQDIDLLAIHELGQWLTSEAPGRKPHTFLESLVFRQVDEDCPA